jgi:ribokinase
VSGRVLVVGSANVDVVLQVDQLPDPGETVLATDVLRGFGGKGANQAVAAAAAGAEVAMVGRLGDDPIGALYRERLAGLGVDVRHLLRTPGRRTGTAYVMVDRDGENSIVVDPGANAAVEPADLTPVAELGPHDVLLVQCELPGRVVTEAIRRAHAAGARVILNLAPFRALPADVMAFADPMVVNEEEAQAISGFGAALAERLGQSVAVPGSLLVTRGAQGATWDDLQLAAQPVPVDEVVDTTGAGDAFCGALAAALATGLGRSDALARAIAAGADAVRRVGAQPI